MNQLQDRRRPVCHMFTVDLDEKNQGQHWDCYCCRVMRAKRGVPQIISRPSTAETVVLDANGEIPSKGVAVRLGSGRAGGRNGCSGFCASLKNLELRLPIKFGCRQLDHSPPADILFLEAYM